MNQRPAQGLGTRPVHLPELQPLDGSYPFPGLAPQGPLHVGGCPMVIGWGSLGELCDPVS